MKRTFATVLVVLFLAPALFAQTERYLVATRGRAAAERAAILGELGSLRGQREYAEFTSVNGFVMALTPDEVRQLRKSPLVRFIEPDWERHALSDSVAEGKQTIPYGVTLVDAPPVWSETKGIAVDQSAPVHVAVIDTGIDYDYPELARAYKGGFNEIDQTTDPRDDNGHGTHVAGTIAAADDGVGVIGVAPDVDLYAIKVLNACGSGSTSNIIKAVDWVIAKKQQVGGNWIMSLSLGSDSSSVMEEEAFKRASDAGILTFAASGNGFDNTATEGLSFPAGYSSVISVGAIDSSLNIAAFSQRGADLKLVAPGVDVLSTLTSSYEVERVADDANGSVLAARLKMYNTSNDQICASGGTVSGNIASGGVGNVSDLGGVSGKIAVIERGGTSAVTGKTLTFAEKATNAKKAGAIGVIVYNNRATENPTDPPGWGMSGLSSAKDVPGIVVGVTQADGAAILAKASRNFTISFSGLAKTETYANFNGTSMATPHASAAAALAWAVAPTATASQIRLALLNTARDLGTPGFDNVFGFGLIDAFAAAKTLAPGRFGLPSTPDPSAPTPGRRFGRRG
jgi:subtilisin family serine protease